MSEKPEVLRLACILEDGYAQGEMHIPTGLYAATELRRLHAANIDCMYHFNAIKAERDELLAVLRELQESAAYWSEYDVPIGIVDKINDAIAKAES